MAQRGTLFLDDVPHEVWRAFHDAPASHDGIQSYSPRQHELHWERARILGASSNAPPAEDGLVRGQALRQRAERIALLETLGAGALERAAHRVSEHHFVLLLADPDGLVVRSEGGGAFRAAAKRTRLIEGASWSEAHRGTNAIGTAASMEQPTVVLGHAHFAEDYRELACYAAPVLDVHGKVVAVLDATSHLRNASRRIGATVAATAQVLSELLRLESYASASSAVFNTLLRTLNRSSEPALVVEAPGRVVRMNAAAAAAGLRMRQVDAVLGVTWNELMDCATVGEGYELALPSGEHYRLHAEPMVGPAGQTLGILVQLEGTPKRTYAPRVTRRSSAFDAIFCEDASMQKALEWAETVAASELPAMILGDTGTGKELVARAVHDASPRSQGPLCVLNCGAIAPALLESELFGYAPATFTGAHRDGRKGLLHAAGGGTLFLDEVAEMPPAMQVALLRVLESKRYKPVGASAEEVCDARIVCATCGDMEAAVEAGNFRRDLYYRLKGAAIRLPSLAERSDVAALAQRLLEDRARDAGWRRAPSLSPETITHLERHRWPGNVRELISTLEVALLRARPSITIEVEHLPPELMQTRSALPAGGMKEAEAGALRRALERCRGNVSAAAKELGIARSTLYRLARRRGVPIETGRE
ncbi:MAG: sigma 54-interacting transcriptional regulator [Myxococcota bacterium]